SGGREEQVITWLDKFVIMEDAKFENKSEYIAQYLIFGPRALEILQKISSESLISLNNFSFIEIEIAGNKVLLQKTNRIIESGWAVFVEKPYSEAVWSFLQTEIEKFGRTAVDEETYDLLRIEAGIPSSTYELNEKHKPSG